MLTVAADDVRAPRHDRRGVQQGVEHAALRPSHEAPARVRRELPHRGVALGPGQARPRQQHQLVHERPGRRGRHARHRRRHLGRRAHRRAPRGDGRARARSPTARRSTTRATDSTRPTCAWWSRPPERFRGSRIGARRQPRRDRRPDHPHGQAHWACAPIAVYSDRRPRRAARAAGRRGGATRSGARRARATSTSIGCSRPPRSAGRASDPSGLRLPVRERRVRRGASRRRAWCSSARRRSSCDAFGAEAHGPRHRAEASASPCSPARAARRRRRSGRRGRRARLPRDDQEHGRRRRHRHAGGAQRRPRSRDGVRRGCGAWPTPPSPRPGSSSNGCVTSARHIEVQVFGDGAGGVRTFGDRDCSLQRRNQKVVEETPAPGLPDGIETLLVDDARPGCAARSTTARRAPSSSSTTPSATSPSFLEVNTRLQVEHPVTEAVFGVDLVEWMLRLAGGDASMIDGPTRRASGHAVEVRVYAEDPARDYRPGAGLLTEVHLPGVAGGSEPFADGVPAVRCDGWIETGTEVTRVVRSAARQAHHPWRRPSRSAGPARRCARRDPHRRHRDQHRPSSHGAAADRRGALLAVRHGDRRPVRGILRRYPAHRRGRAGRVDDDRAGRAGSHRLLACRRTAERSDGRPVVPARQPRARQRRGPRPASSCTARRAPARASTRGDGSA